nr:uncharacterized protein LOC129276106 [Lytechinus pictus]
MGFISYLIDLMASSCEGAQGWIADWTVMAPWPNAYGKRTRCEELNLSKTRFLDDEWTTHDYIDFTAIVLAITLLTASIIVLICHCLPWILAWTSRWSATTLDSTRPMRLRYKTPSNDQIWKQCDSCHRLVRIQRKKVDKTRTM